MSTISLRLPESLHNEVRKLAARENVSINQMVIVAVAEKLSALETEDYLAQRTKRADINAFHRIMAKVPDVAPQEEDRL